VALIVPTRAGGTAVLTPASEIYAALERGVIDAADWIGPHDDLKQGLQNTARYYYYPGWHEPGNTTAFGFNKKAYEALPGGLPRTLDHAAGAVQV
jgi:TRAP-type mannitol/chloroaromatic compound transport system substrate-binding protein